MGGYAVVDGAVVPLDDVRVAATDVALSYGLAVYEVLESGTGRDPWPNLVRLRASAAAIGAPMPSEDVLRDEIARVTAAVGGPAWVSIDLTGDGRRLVRAVPVDPARRHVPTRCARAPHVDHPLLPGSVKHRSRAAWAAEVRRRGVDDLLFVGSDGRFTEGSSCAVVAVVGGVVQTAPWDGRILESTTVRRLLGHAARLGLPVERIGPPAAGPWDALYVASTRRSLAPVVELDGEAVPAWDPVGRALAAADDEIPG